MNRAQPFILTLFFCWSVFQLTAKETSPQPTLLEKATFPIVQEQIADTICAGTCRFIGEEEYCESGTYEVMDQDGGTYQLVLFVKPKPVQYADTDICQGDVYLGEERNQLGKQILSYETEDANGCDMTVVITLNVNQAKSSLINETIGFGECKEFGPNILCQTGEYQLRYSTIHGCDSTVQINLTVEELITDTITQTVCAGETFTIQDSTLNQGGLYQLWGVDAQGRTTLTVVDFRVESEIITRLEESSCEGQPYFISDISHTESGSYEYMFRAANGCDSLVQLELSVGEVVTTEISQIIPRGESYIVGKNNVSFEGRYEFLYQTVAGCDSVVHLNLSFFNNDPTSNPSTGNPNNPTEEEEEEMETTDTETGEMTPDTSNQNILPCYEPKIVDSICFEDRPFILGNNTFWEGGIFNVTYDPPVGCDIRSIELQLFIETDRTEIIEQTICEGDSLIVGGITFKSAKDTLLELQAASGCDSLVMIAVSVATPRETFVEKTICAGDLLTINGQFVTRSGIYTELHQTIEGCDSLVTTNLIIDGFETQNTSLELCAGDCYEDDAGNRGCTNGTYNFHFQSVSGCDSLVIVDLLIPDTVRAEVWDTFCKGSTYEVGIFAVTQPGRYREKFISHLGCDSIIHFNLFHVDCEITSRQNADTIICGGNTGQFSFSLVKGQSPFMYKWSSEDGVYSGQGSIELEEEVIEQQLPGGRYTVTVTDRFEEEAVLELEIIRPKPITSQFLTPEFRGTNFACANDSNAFLEVIPSGGIPPYKYEWSTGATRRRLNNLPSGDYSVTITDQYNCPHVTQQSLREPPELVMLATATDPLCEDAETGSIEVNVMQGGTPPYQYRLAGINYSDIGAFEDLAAGDYQLFVRDANDCLMDSVLSIEEPDIIELFYEPEVTIELGDQVPLKIFPSHPVSIVEWEGPEGLSCYDCLDPILEPLESSSYEVTITSEDDCITTASLRIKVAKERDVFIPTAFSPNRDGVNDFFTIHAGPEVASVNYFRVYSRWGELLFEKNDFDPNDPQLGWDGQFRGNEMSHGTYIWIAQLTFIDEVVEEYTGDVLLSK